MIRRKPPGSQAELSDNLLFTCNDGRIQKRNCSDELSQTNRCENWKELDLEVSYFAQTMEMSSEKNVAA